jgi:hypothetical protein
MALSALHRLQGLAPSHYNALASTILSKYEAELTFDFFSRQRSQALHTRLRMPPSIGEEGSRGGVIIVAPFSGGVRVA